MKTIKELKSMDNKAVIDSFEGYVTAIYPAKEPTPAQKNKGIHSQSIQVSGGAGESGQVIYVTLLKQHFHIDKSLEGDRFRFESTNDDKGNLGGLVISKWDKDGVIQTGVDVWGSATIYSLEKREEKSAAQSSTPDPASDPASGVVSSIADQESGEVSQKSANNSVDIKGGRPALAVPNGRIAAQARLHLACYLTVQSTHAALSLDPHTLKDIATSVSIEMNRSGKSVSSEVKAIYEDHLIKMGEMIFDSGDSSTQEPDQQITVSPPTQESAPDVSTQPPSSQEELEKQREAKPELEKFNKNWRAIQDEKGRLICQLAKEDLIDVLIKYLPFHATESPKIKTVLNAAVRSMKELELTYCEIYDVLDILLQNDHNKAAIDNAYDNFKKGAKDDESLCKTILFDQSTFKQEIKNHEPVEV